MSKLEGRKRAIDDEQKEERRQTIIDMAWQLFQRKGYESLTVAEVAEALGLAKGTMFRYFPTKEALFLTVVQQQLTIWFAQVDRHLSVEAEVGIQEIVALFGRELEARPGLTRLLAILHTLLERNIDFATAATFKRMLAVHFARTGGLLEQRLPFLVAGQGAHLLLQSHALVIGLWHLADPAPVVREVLEQPEFGMFAVEFANEFSQALTALLYGLELRARRTRGNGHVQA